ncbi:hypothetical protein ACIQ62_34840 [Streptomyces sp. NPDC096319]|uniref:hypothetical protein n=1 Tax=Streptomyces sp. NPDC096319 TaxID=3366084 RepID=UPI00382855A6
MEAAELAVAAVGVVVATATGAATGLGEGMGAAAAELVRTRLGATDRGRAALERLDEAPAAPGVREEAQEVVREEIEADQEWRDRLQVQLTSRSAHTTTHVSGGVLISGGRVSRNQIVAGPLTINNTPGNKALIAAAVVLVLVLVSFGTYGIVQVVTSDNTQGPSQGASTGPLERPAPGVDASSAATPAPTATTPRFDLSRDAMEVLLYQDEMPSWLEYHLPASVQSSESGPRCTASIVTYARPDSQSSLVSFRADACDAVDSAQSQYSSRVMQLEGGVDSGPLQPVPVAPLGDVRVSYVREEPVSHSKMRFVTVRSGRIVLRFVYGPINEKAAFPKEIDTMISTFVKKAEAKPVE